MQHKLFLTLLLFMSLLSGCSDTAISSSQLIGHYVNNAPNIVETIQVKSDGTYVHVIESKDSKKTNIGKWSFYDRDEDHRIVFHSFIFAEQPWNTNKNAGEWPAIVEWRSGRLFIPVAVDTEASYGFERQ